jgi:hypothetical protein
MINISPIFGQSRAKKKEIIADSKIAKENSLKRIPYGSTFQKSVRLRYLPNVGKGGFIVGGAAGNGARAGRFCKVIATEHRIPQAHKRIGKFF